MILSIDCKLRSLGLLPVPFIPLRPPGISSCFATSLALCRPLDFRPSFPDSGCHILILSHGLPVPFIDSSPRISSCFATSLALWLCTAPPLDFLLRSRLAYILPRSFFSFFRWPSRSYLFVFVQSLGFSWDPWNSIACTRRICILLGIHTHIRSFSVRSLLRSTYYLRAPVTVIRTYILCFVELGRGWSFVFLYPYLAVFPVMIRGCQLAKTFALHWKEEELLVDHQFVWFTFFARTICGRCT